MGAVARRVRSWQRLGVSLSGVFLALSLLAAPSAAKDPGSAASAAPTSLASAEAPEPSAEQAEPSPWKQGPTGVDLGHEIELELPRQHAFLPREFAVKALEQNGNFHNEKVLGVVAPVDHASDWFVVIQYEDEGYVKDDEKIDAKELLDSLREGNAEANQERKERGFPELTLDGWSEPPHYDSSHHQLVWALVVSDKNGKSVNYNTRILGRHGYVSLNLVTDPGKLAGFKSEATTLLASTRFRQGSRYEDFDSSKDKVAEYGLAGLVAAGAGLGAAKLVKLGLLAKFWKVIVVGLLAAKKAIVLAIVGAGAYLKRLFSNRNKNEAAG